MSKEPLNSKPPLKPGDPNGGKEVNKSNGKPVADGKTELSQNSKLNNENSDSKGTGASDVQHQYSLNNYPYDIKIELDNGTHKMLINPQTIVYLKIDDSLSKWDFSGEIVVGFNFDTIENNGEPRFIFRNDGFDFLKIYIKPTDPEKVSSTDADSEKIFSKIPQHLLAINLWASIVHIEDLNSPYADDATQHTAKYKRFVFRDYRYQKMSTSYLEYSTAMSPSLNSNSDVVPDEARAIPTSDILDEVIKLTDIDERLKKVAKDVKPDEWDASGGKFFYTTGSQETILDTINTVLEHHISKDAFTYPFHVPPPPQGNCSTGSAGGTGPGAADGAPPGDSSTTATGNITTNLASIAAQDIGAFEEPRGQNRGPQVEKFFKYTGLGFGSPWCAAAVSYWVGQWMQANNITSFKPPKINACFSWPPWAQQNGIGVATGDPRPGDVVVMTCSHIVICESAGGGKYTHVSGNTNSSTSRDGDGVYRNTSSNSTIRNVIRFSEIGSKPADGTAAT
jgi:hypothetical protein